MPRWTFPLILASLACASVVDPTSTETCLEEGTVPLYDRDAWGRWRDDDRDCQDTRAEVLIRDSLDPVAFAEGGACRVITGKWFDPYTGIYVTDAGLVDIDHRVPLEEAHRSGGWVWDRERKRNFANDIDNLVAAGRSANRSKGSRGPIQWLPPFEATRCPYLDKWVATKEKWGLTEDEREAAVIGYMRLTCARGGLPVSPQDPES